MTDSDGGDRGGGDSDGADRNGADSDEGEKGESDTGSNADGLVETVHARGHEHVTAEHASTFEFTTDDWLTPAGDCILAVDADTTPREFDPTFKEACRDADATITATIAVEADEKTHEETITGRGDPELALMDDRSMVGRTSDYTDDERTIVVDADGAAADLDRDLVAALADGAPVTLRLEVTPSE